MDSSAVIIKDRRMPVPATPASLGVGASASLVQLAAAMRAMVLGLNGTKEKELVIGKKGEHREGRDPE